MRKWRGYSARLEGNVKNKKIVIMGIRGIPANFGGSETIVEELGERLSKEGFEFVVYCRKWNSTTDSKEYKGMKRIVLPSINKLSLDTPTHTFFSVIHNIIFNTGDTIHAHGVGNALFFPILKLFNRKIIVTVDGPDWLRPKWGIIARTTLKLSFLLTLKFADVIISDNIPVQKIYKDRYNKDTVYIPYGADLSTIEGEEALKKYGLEKRKYILFVGGIIPDKGVHILVKAFEKIDTDMKLCIIGDTPYFSEYKKEVMSTKDKRIIFTGYLYGKPYRQILQNAYLYVHPLLADGTSPSLLQSMAAGNCIVASALPETSYVIGDAGIKFEPGNIEELSKILKNLIDNPDLVEKMRKKARKRTEEFFTWDLIAEQHKKVYLSL